MRIQLLPLVIGALLFSSVATAQDWSVLNSAPRYRLITPYCLNPNVGFVFPAGLAFQGVFGRTGSKGLLSRTTDGGNSWTSLPFWDTLNCSIAQIYFVSANHGYLAAISMNDFVTPKDAGIYETYDTGSSWTRITPDSTSFSAVYATDDAVYATEYAEQTSFGIPAYEPLMVTRDDGKHWLPVTGVSGLLPGETPQYQYVTGNKEGLVTAIYYDSLINPHLVFSSNGGKDWQSRTLTQGGSRSWPMVALFSMAHRLDLVREYVPDNDQQFDTYTLLRSVDNFANKFLSLGSKEIGAWVAGNACVMYVSNAIEQPGPGVWRSTNGGLNWQFVQGPDFEELDDQDYQNLSVVGHGAVVYAGDRLGQLWKTTTGGDGTLSAGKFQSKFVIDHGFPNGSVDTLQAVECDTASMQVITQSLTCNYAKLRSITISGLDPSEYTQTTIHHPNTDGLPDTTIAIIKPINAGIRNLIVHTTFVDDEYETIDSSIAMTLSVKPYTGPVVGVDVKPSQVSGVAGDTVGVPIYIFSSQQAHLGTTSISLDYRFNTDLLQPIAFVPAMSAFTATPLILKPNEVTTTLNASGSLDVNGEMLLGWLKCRMILVDTTGTNVSLASVTISATGAGCTAQSLPTDFVQVSRLNQCGDSTLLTFMNGTPMNTILSIIPNPASTSLTVQFQNKDHELIAYELFDATGFRKLVGSTSQAEVLLDVSSLPTGVYFLRSISARGLPSSRKLLVRK